MSSQCSQFVIIVLPRVENSSRPNCMSFFECSIIICPCFKSHLIGTVHIFIQTSFSKISRFIIPFPYRSYACFISTPILIKTIIQIIIHKCSKTQSGNFRNIPLHRQIHIGIAGIIFSISSSRINFHIWIFLTTRRMTCTIKTSSQRI